MSSSESSSETIAIIALVVALGTNFPDRVIKPSINIIGFLPLTKEFVAGVTPCRMWIMRLWLLLILMAMRMGGGASLWADALLTTLQQDQSASGSEAAGATRTRGFVQQVVNTGEHSKLNFGWYTK